MRLWALVVTAASLCALGLGSPVAEAGTLPSGFVDSVAIKGLDAPTAVRFTASGEIFIAQKNGEILRFEDFTDETPTVFADLREQVYDYGDRGLLGLALDPDYPTRPYVYALYTFDHVLGEEDPGEYPAWGQPPTYEGDDSCLGVATDTVDACPVSGRLVRLTEEGGVAGHEDVLLEDWCQQFSSHSVGDLEFGPEGALFVSGGEGASFNDADYGQFGWPHKNQCGDPPGPIGQGLEIPTAEGGSLRSQDVLTPFDPLAPSDPTGLDGTLIRIDPNTGAGWPGNPLASSPDPNERRLIAFGFRNPFRFAINPRTEEVYVGNVGSVTDEEIDRVPLESPALYNSGWPCYEGPTLNPEFNNRDLDLCEGLYDEPGAASEPFFYYSHSSGVTPADHCPIVDDGSAITGSTFYEGGAFPDEYEGALFFADSVRGCIYAMLADGDGELDPLSTRNFLSDGGPYTGADIEVGPGGDLFYLSLFGDEALHRISYDPGAPIARIAADKEWGPLDLKVKFDGGGSEDPDGGQLTYAWDLDGNGSFETTGPTPSKEYKVAENTKVTLRVKDPTGKTSTAQTIIYAGDSPPQVEIAEPLGSTTWEVGQQVDFSGSAKAEGGSGGQLPSTSLYWRTSLQHCPGGVGSCHAHPLRVFPATASGQLIMPNHDYPSGIKFSLTATDDRGLSATKTVEILSLPVALQIASDPPGVTLTAGNLTAPAPFSLTAIKGANVGLLAPPTAQLGGQAYSFAGWSDGGARVHSVSAGGPATYTASYAKASQAPTGDTPTVQPDPNQASTAPGTPILGAHPAKRAGTVARFAFKAPVADARYRCKLDSKAFAPCRSPKVYRHLKPGRHVFRVVAEDPLGTARSPATVFRWRVL